MAQHGMAGQVWDRGSTHRHIGVIGSEFRYPISVTILEWLVAFIRWLPLKIEVVEIGKFKGRSPSFAIPQHLIQTASFNIYIFYIPDHPVQKGSPFYVHSLVWPIPSGPVALSNRMDGASLPSLGQFLQANLLHVITNVWISSASTTSTSSNTSTSSAPTLSAFSICILDCIDVTLCTSLLPSELLPSFL